MEKTDILVLTYEDGELVMKDEAGKIRNFLNQILKKPRFKGTGFCPTLDLDEEGFVKEIENGFSQVKASDITVKVVEKPWYPSKKCPRCKKVHKYPINLKFRK